MKRYLHIVIVLFVLIVISTRDCRAQNVSLSSAELIKPTHELDFDYRVENLKNFFQKYDSPLEEYAEDFVKYADKNELDYRLIPAITGVESTFGKRIPLDSYNAYGWANGSFAFESWEESIACVSETLKTKYIDRGAESIYEIARIYAPPSTTWGSKVTYFVSKIDTIPLNFDII